MGGKRNGRQIKWSKTRSTGVRYWESETRKYRGRPDRCYVIRFKNQGKSVSETVGWLSEGITEVFCSNIRGQIVSNIRTGQGFYSLKEKRAIETAKKKVDQSKAISLKMAFDEFLSTRSLKQNTIREYRRSLNTAFDDWKQIRVVDITRDMVAQRHRKLKTDAQKKFRQKTKQKLEAPDQEEVEKRGGAQANLHMRFLRSLLNFCAGYYEDGHGEPLLKNNPVQRLSQTKQWFRVPRRQTIIKSHQLPAWFKALINLKNEVIRDYLLFVLLTGCRKQEGLTLETKQVDVKAKTCIFLDPKNRTPLTLPLPSYLYGILRNRIEKQGFSKYVFPGKGKSGHLIEPKEQLNKIIKESEVNFTLHDLRRHFITIADSLDLSVFAIKQLVNHSTGQDVTGGYVIPDVERLRGPMQKIEDKILTMSGVKKKTKIVPLQRVN